GRRGPADGKGTAARQDGRRRRDRGRDGDQRTCRPGPREDARKAREYGSRRRVCRDSQQSSDFISRRGPAEAGRLKPAPTFGHISDAIQGEDVSPIFLCKRVNSWLSVQIKSK